MGLNASLLDIGGGEENRVWAVLGTGAAAGGGASGGEGLTVMLRIEWLCCAAALVGLALPRSGSCARSTDFCHVDFLMWLLVGNPALTQLLVALSSSGKLVVDFDQR